MSNYKKEEKPAAKAQKAKKGKNDSPHPEG
jgi:hypothetical protein